MQRYLRPDLLEAAGISDFDSWAATFGQTVTQIEVAPEGGNSFRHEDPVRQVHQRPRDAPHAGTSPPTSRPPTTSTSPSPPWRRGPPTASARPRPSSSSRPTCSSTSWPRSASGPRRSATGTCGPTRTTCSRSPATAAAPPSTCAWSACRMTDPGKIDAAADRIAAHLARAPRRRLPGPGGQPIPRSAGALQLVFCDLGTPGAGWNVYDELRDQLVARGMPREAIRFIHDAATDRDKGELFAACRAGTRRRPDRLAPRRWASAPTSRPAPSPCTTSTAPGGPPTSPSAKAASCARATRTPRSRSCGTSPNDPSTATCGRPSNAKPAFIAQVMRGRLDVREIEDIGDTALSYNEVKALATGNPLLIDNAEADAELTRLERAERAHHRNQEALQHKVAQADQRITALTTLIDHIGIAIARRTDTRGDAFTMTIDGMAYTKRTDAGRRLQQLVAQLEQDLLKSSHRRLEERPGQLGGFPVVVTVERVLGSMNVITALDGAPGTEIRMTPAEVKAADPGKLIIRLENRLSGLESLSSRSQSEIDQLITEAAHARDDIAKPFPQALQLTAARNQVALLDEKLRATAALSQHGNDNRLVMAVIDDTMLKAEIPQAALSGSGRQDDEPRSAAQVSLRDFPLDNPLAGTAPVDDQVASSPGARASRVTRHLAI